MKKKKYVVTGKGSIVEEYDGVIQYFVKKYGIEPYINFLLNFWDFILLQAKTSNLYRELLNIYKELWAYLEKILQLITSIFEKAPILQLA